MNRGIVESINGYTATIRVPEFNKIEGAIGATPNDELDTAIICTIPGCNPNLRVGDIVILGYENDDEGQPIILGVMFSERSLQEVTDLKTNSIDVLTNAKLPADTSIGLVSRQEIANLLGTNQNIQLTFNDIEKKIEDLSQQIKNLSSQLNAIINDVYKENV